MFVLSELEWAVLQASLPIPKNCDLCGKPFEEGQPRETHKHGPFKLHVCCGCKLLFCRHELRKMEGSR